MFCFWLIPSHALPKRIAKSQLPVERRQPFVVFLHLPPI